MSDLISRETAIEALTNYAKFLWNTYHETCNLAGMIDAIDNMPTIDPAKRGRWEQVGDNAWKCSRCGEVSCCEGSYCPDCGARMDGEEG